MFFRTSLRTGFRDAGLGANPPRSSLDAVGKINVGPMPHKKRLFNLVGDDRVSKAMSASPLLSSKSDSAGDETNILVIFRSSWRQVAGLLLTMIGGSSKNGPEFQVKPKIGG